MRLIKGLQGAAFGLVDGVICISGLVIGVAIATSNVGFIAISAITGGLTDALGNSIGMYLAGYSERSSQIHSKEHGIETSVHSHREILDSSILSFLTTLLVVVMMLAPFYFLDVGKSIIVCVLLSIMTLFCLGIYVSKLSGESPIRTSIKFVAFAIVGATFSYLIGNVLKEGLTHSFPFILNRL